MRTVLIFGLLLALAFHPPAAAHDARPLAVVVDVAGKTVTLSWTAPPSVDARNAPLVTLAAPCTPRSTIVARASRAGRIAYSCPKGLARIDIQYPYFNPSLSTAVRINRPGRDAQGVLLAPDVRSWTPSEEPDFWSVALSYFELGIAHILIGLDHVLFIAGLLILSVSLPRTLVTITGFTLTHSVTLILVSLGVLNVSIPAIEATIALSIVFVAAEIAHGRRDTLAWRRPVAVASAFGLLHGAGFAAVLGEIGLPRTERVWALLAFNLGVEAGQLIIVSAAFGALCVVSWLRARYFGAPTPFPSRAPKIAGYALGIVAAFWLVERTMAVIA